MKQRYVKLLSCLLAMIMLLSSVLTLASCGESNEADPKDTDASKSTSAVDGTVAEGETERIPQYEAMEKEKFNREFVICARSDMKEEFEIKQ